MMYNERMPWSLGMLLRSATTAQPPPQFRAEIRRDPCLVIYLCRVRVEITSCVRTARLVQLGRRVTEVSVS